MGERRGTKALELWCRRITDGYPGVSVQNMTTSWRDGLAFCAMIHHFRPDLIDFSSLNKDDIYGNNELAFRTAEQQLGIPALLDAEDMASCTVPDRLSILTYLSQFYQVFGGSSPSRLALNRTSESSSERIGPVVPESPQPKVSSRLGMRREPCASCGLPVFLAEKLVVARSVYHRSCFKCARCRHQLTPGNYYETEAGQYCCEACPLDDDEPTSTTNDETLHRQQPHVTSHREPPDDEQQQQPAEPQQNVDATSSSSRVEDEAALLEAPLSDEEKSKRRSLDRSVDRLLQSQRSKLDLISSHLLGDKLDELSVREDDQVDGDEKPEPAEIQPSGESDEEKSARSLLEQTTAEDDDKSEAVQPASSALLPDDDGNDDQFDEMIKLISDRIDELTTEEQTASSDEQKPEEEVEEAATASPDGRASADVNSAPQVVEISGSDDEKRREEAFKLRLEEARRQEERAEAAPALRRSSSLRGAGVEHTKDPRPAEPRRLSLVQRRLRLFEAGAEQLEPQPPQQQQQPDRSVVDSLAQKEEEQSQDYPDDLNPFASDEESSGKTARRSKPPSTNPFGSDDEEEEEPPPKPMARTRSKTGPTMARENEPPRKRLLEAPQINLNPFWSDDEEPESENETELRNKSPPVPKPRTLSRHSQLESGGLQPKSNLISSSIHSSNTSIASSCSTITPGGTYRKKKPAPPPPLLNQSLGTPTKSPNTSVTSNASLSPRLTPRTRKSKPAPPPPMQPAAASTPDYRHSTSALPDDSVVLRQKLQEQRDNETRTSEQPQQHVWDEEKLSKDEANRNTQSLQLPYSTTDKSVEGKWKRKKGPAPARPMPLRRKIKVMSMKDVKLELDQIEMQQQGLERQGVRLEQIIRDKCENGTASEDTSLGMDVEELVLELFALVNEKNELFRRQAELMLLRRQQRLEEEHADIEYQVRCLITQPEATKTDFDKQREEALIQRLVEIVERRNEIVECLEMDRRREIEEDRSIHREMDLYAARSKTDNVNMTDESRRSSKLKKGKVKEKTKEKKSKKSNKKDADKDVDETEAKLKRHSLRKWF